MMCYRLGKANKTCFGERQARGRIGEIVVSPFSDSKLGFEILKAIKAMGGIEFFIVLAVTAFDLAVMPGCIRPDQFVPNPQTLKLSFKKSGFTITFGKQSVCKLCTIVCLYAFNGKGELFDNMAQEHSGRIRAVLRKASIYGSDYTHPGRYIGTTEWVPAALQMQTFGD